MPGKIIRAALVILFFGTIVLGALSFLIYFTKEETKKERSSRYAAGLRRELDASSLERHEKIIRDAFTKPNTERNRTLSSYLESTFGPENMGYTVRAFASKADPSAAPVALDIEITGSKRPNDIVLVACGYLPGLETFDPTSLSKPLAVTLGVAHALTGGSSNKTIRFVSLENSAALTTYYSEAIGNNDRITHIFLLGNLVSASDDAVLKTLHLEGRGTVLKRHEITTNLLGSAQALKNEIVQLAERL